jgi:hypothetical protein
MIMRIFRLLAIAAATMANPPLLHAKGDNSQLNCILEHAARDDIEAVWSAQHEHRTPTAAESAAMDRVAGVAGPCIDRHHWSRERAAMAITYAVARVNFEDALHDLAARGVPRPVFDRIAADLGERGRAAITNQDRSDGNFEFVGQTVARDLSEAHVPVQSGSPELIEIARSLAHALSAQVDMDRANALFSSP